MLAFRDPVFGELVLPFRQALNAAAAPDRMGWWQCFSPSADIREAEAGYEIELDVPGLGEKDIEIVLENRHLTLRGERKPTEGNYTRRERSFGRFERVFHLPEDADLQRIEAKARNGVLTVKVPRLESAKPRSIEVKTE